MSDGAHTYTANATDAAGNTSSASTAVHVTVDTQAPAAAVIVAPADHSYQSSHNVAVSGTAEAGSTVSVLDGSSTVATVAANGSGNWSTTITAVSDGAHTYTANATDAAGNTGSASSPVHVTVDDVPPVTSITSGTTSTNDAGFSFTSSEAGSTFECGLTGPNEPGGFTACSSPIAYSHLASGSYTFSVRATDRAGNIDPTPPTWSFTVQPASTGGGATTSGGTGAPAPSTSSSATSAGSGPPVASHPSTSPAPSRIGSLGLASSTFTAASSGPSATAALVSSGSTITFKLSASGPVYFRVEISTPGRQLHGRCITRSRTPHGARCTQVKRLAGSFRWNGHAGFNRLHFSGRLAGKKLKAGHYRLIATSASGQSLRTPFRIAD